MHPRYCTHPYKEDTFECLKKEYDSIKLDVKAINNMKISQKAKEIVLKELQEQIDNVKERMHNVIDTY